MQQAVVEWCQVVASVHNRPEYGYIMAIPNGQYRRGQRPEPGHPTWRARFVPAVARRGHHGLWLELKFGRNTTTAQQDWWLATLREQGYCCAVVRSLEEAQEVIDWYLRGTR
ncbi:MAG: hypothetical protein KatS3mg051_1169 [Anaerolineae bacterium]|nr:MAG: hypothetical protein KatS3mg051_1169 [Anaerolineae bacterium]